MVDFGKSDQIIEINGKVDKPTLTMDSMIFCSFHCQCWFIHFSSYIYISTHTHKS